MPHKTYPVSETNLNGNELKYVSEAVSSTWISSNGKYIDLFEKEFAEYIGTKHAVAVNNGTVALHLALMALGISEGDEVIVPNLTYIATANAVTYVGATPVFADSNPISWNIDPASIEKLITKKTRAIIPVHLYGNPCDMDALSDICKRHNLWLIEDAAEAIGSKYKGRNAGSFGIISTYSFYGNKTITTGEGGMVLTDDDALAGKIRLLKGQGMSFTKRYWFEIVGYNYRMTNVQAAIGHAQMERINELVDAKRSNAKLYNKYLGSVDKLILPDESHGCINTYWMYSIVLKDHSRVLRDEFAKRLTEMGIDSRPFFYLMTEMPPYANHKKDDCNISLQLAQQGLNLPSSTLLKEDDIKYICECIKKCL